jgi:hypothetical protein
VSEYGYVLGWGCLFCLSVGVLVYDYEVYIIFSDTGVKSELC